jgi:hypothetical protein
MTDIDITISICYNVNMSLFPTKGEKRFDQCALKAVTYVESVYTQADGASTESIDDWSGTSYGSAGVRPRLTCPKTEDMELGAIMSDKEQDFEGYRTKRRGLANLRKVAGATACTACEYAGKTVIEVAEMRTARAEAETRALIAEANLKSLQDKVDRGEDIVADLPPNGGIYTPSLEPASRAIH